MSDYMFMLESHLRPAQQKALQVVQAVAAETQACVFLTGGALRDMLGGFPVRDLDFAVEGDAVKLAKAVAARTGAKVLVSEETRKRVELEFSDGTIVEIGMARQEQYPKPGGKPVVTPATIYEDLKRRDFTINAIALSVNRASRGLLIDPVNGRSDLDLREIRAVSNYGFYDDPVRLLRMWRYQTRLGFTIAEKTQRQYQNAREAGMAGKISAKALTEEVRQMASENNPGDLLKRLDEEGLLELVSPALTGAKLNLTGFAKLAKMKQIVPFNVDLHVNPLGLFLSILTDPLSPKERAALEQKLTLTAEESDNWHKLASKAKRLEKALQATGLQRPSNLYETLVEAPGEQVLYLLLHSTQRLVLDRIRNYLQKYAPMALEVTDQEVMANGVTPGTAQFEKKKAALIAAKLNSRPKKPAPIPEAPPPPVPTRGLRAS